MNVKNEFKSLNDYEEHLHINLDSHVILDIINDGPNRTKFKK